MFEGSMNMFVFYWIPALNSVHKPADGKQQSSDSELPYSTIYSSFMIASMAGALGCNIIMHKQTVKYSRLLIAVLLVANFCFIKLAGSTGSEATAFWIFCVLEACAGMYGPCVAYLKALLVDNHARTSVYSLMRLPLNIVVIISLLATKGSENINGIFSSCSLMLTMALATTWVASVRGMP
jgi:MFS transporter, MFS domain-containing protein family, molybdate-anion transporter